MQDLVNLGDRAQPGLRRLLAAKSITLETRRRAESLLEKLHEAHLQELRAIEVLENIGNAEVRQLLEQLGRGAPRAPRTVEAKAALDRLARR
jgi:hypothetical protein